MKLIIDQGVESLVELSFIYLVMTSFILDQTADIYLAHLALTFLAVEMKRSN